MINKIIQGDVFSALAFIPSESVDCIVTSPPYWGLRDYGVSGQLGLEKTPELFINNLVLAFREMKRVLRKDGTLWLNLGDTYANRSAPGQSSPMKRDRRKLANLPKVGVPMGLKTKDLIGIPWRVALALQADGWYLRQDIIWSKPNPMPESVTDRCTKSHEYVFLLSKSRRYYFDQDAIREPISESSFARLSQDIKNQRGSDRAVGKTNGRMKAVLRKQPNGWANSKNYHGATPGNPKRKEWVPTDGGSGSGFKGHSGNTLADGTVLLDRNRRSVWTVTTRPFKDAHFATFPEALIEPMILAGSRLGGVVLDPFMGAGTTAVVAMKQGRKFLGIELNPEYIKIAEKRINNTQQNLFNGKYSANQS